jgi:hypothetical protein
MLREIDNKSVAMQRSIDDLARFTGDNLSTIGKRMTTMEVSRSSFENLATAQTATTNQRPPPPVEVQQQPKEPVKSPRSQFFAQSGLQNDVSVFRELQWLLHNGENEAAFSKVLNNGEGNEVDLLRLMHKFGIRPQLLKASTRNQLYWVICSLLKKDEYVDHLLPWIFQLVSLKLIGELERPVKEEMKRILNEISARANEGAVVAARLVPYVD